MASDEDRIILENHPDAEDYRMLIENAWKDLHHSRLQEWSSLVVVTGVHWAAIQILEYSNEIDKLNLFSIRHVLATAFAIGTLFALFGAAITCRHRKIMSTKMKWITDSEFKLGLMKDDKQDEKQNEKGIIISKDVKIPSLWPQVGSVSFFILVFYGILVIVDMFIIAGLLKG